MHATHQMHNMLTGNDCKMHSMSAIYDHKMHSMACALGQAEHAKMQAIRFCNHQNRFKFHQNTFKSTFQRLPDVEIDSEISFLYQLFKGNSKIILLQPSKVIFLCLFSFFFLSFCIYLYIHLNKVTF